MKHCLNFRLFNEFWINCDFNLKMSILSTINPDFKKAAYINDYKYRILDFTTSEGTQGKYLMLDPYIELNKLFLNRYITYQPFDLEKDYVTQIKKLILQNKTALIGVDLFYWIPKSVCWQKHHWEHHSFLNGFDDEKKIFYVFDDDLNGYDMHEIPEQRLITAVTNSSLLPKAYFMSIADDIKPFYFQLDDLLIHAKKIKTNIQSIDVKSLWILRNEDVKEGHMLDLFAMFIFQISNRYYGNVMLFKKLYDLGILNDKELSSS